MSVGKSFDSVPFCFNVFRVICSKSISDEEEHRIQRMVYDYLKGQKNCQTIFKCDKESGPIGEVVEEITINQPILVRTQLLHILLLGWCRLLECVCVSNSSLIPIEKLNIQKIISAPRCQIRRHHIFRIHGEWPCRWSGNHRCKLLSDWSIIEKTKFAYNILNWFSIMSICCHHKWTFLCEIEKTRHNCVLFLFDAFLSLSLTGKLPPIPSDSV